MTIQASKRLMSLLLGVAFAGAAIATASAQPASAPVVVTPSGKVAGIRTGDGAAVRWALCNAYPENDAIGGLRHVVFTFVDITSLKQAQQQQRALEQQLSHLFQPVCLQHQQTQTNWATTHLQLF